MAVGNTSFDAIHGASDSLEATTTPANLGLTADGAPFGGYLRFRLEFDNAILTDLPVRHYLVTYRKPGFGNPFVPLTAAVFRHYEHAGAGGSPVVDPYLLGPHTVGGRQVFDLPPVSPPGGGQWVIANPVTDTTSAAFEAAFAPPADAGIYEFKLDLFDAAGAQVNATAVGIRYWLPTTIDLTGSIPTRDASSLGLVTAGGSFIFRLHIDNNQCVGSMDAPRLGSQVASPSCGVLDYGDPAQTMTLRFAASHPNGFARYRFLVVRGATLALGPIDAPVDPPPGAETLTPTVASLLGGCRVAGMAQDLVVWATATDGWNRQSQYDSDPLPWAFVLEPAP
jgi:hypothetical protein